MYIIRKKKRVFTLLSKQNFFNMKMSQDEIKYLGALGIRFTVKHRKNLNIHSSHNYGIFGRMQTYMTLKQRSHSYIHLWREK